MAMKKTVNYLKILLLIALPSTAMAQNGDNRVSAYEYQKLSAQEKNEYDQSVWKFSRCIRDLVEAGGGGITGFDQVVTYLDRSMANPYPSKDFFRERTKTCLQLGKSLGSTVVSTETKLEFVRVNQNRISQKALKLLFAFLHPIIKCTNYGVGGSLALFVGVSANVAVATCQSTTGRHWIELRGGVGGGVGVGAEFSGFKIDDPLKQRINHPFPFSGNTRIQVTQGFILMGSASNEKEKEPNGYGIGGGWILDASANGGIKIIPLGTDAESLAQAVLSNLFP